MPRSTRLLILLALAAFVAVYQPHQTFSVDLASDSADKFLDNFHAPERGYRWSQARSAVWLSGLGGGNLRWDVHMLVSGSRPAGIAAPHVTVRVNGQPRGEFVAANEERDYEFVVAPWQLGANGDLLLELDAETFTAQNDPRELGVRVLRVWATPSDGFALPSLKVFGFLLAIAVAGMSIARSLRGQLLTPSSAGRTASNFQSLNLILCLIVTLIVPLAINRAEAAWWIVVVALCVLGVAALFALVAWIAPRERMNARQWNVWLIVFAVAALVRFALDTGRGYEGDVAIYLSLAWKTVTYGIHSAYLTVSDVPPPNTPPFLLYPLWLLGWLYQQIFSPLFPPTWLNDPPILRFMLRLPSLAADVLIAAIICRVTGSSQQSAVNSEPSTVNRSPFTVHRSLLTALYLFNPAVIFDSAYWGQTAAVHTLWMLLAVVAVARARFGWAGVTLALAVLTKPQSLAIAPLVVFIAWRERRRLRCALATSVTWLVVNAPFIVTGNVASVLQQVVQTAQYHPYLSVNAHNLWWLLTGLQGWQPDTLIARSAGFALFGLATLLSLAVVWRDRRELWLAAAYQSLAFFMLLTQIHENHLLPMFAPLAIACALDRKRWWLYGAFALTALTNVALHDPNIVMTLGFPAEEIYGGPALAWPRWINAVAQVTLFGVFTVEVWRETWRRGDEKTSKRVAG